MTISADQCRAARALLGWSQEKLSEAAGVARKTIADLEREARTPYPDNMALIRTALERAGAIFIAENGEGSGVRLRKKKPAAKRK